MAKKAKEDYLLIIFIDNPVAGKVMRKIAAVKSGLYAVEIYKELMLFTKRIIDRVKVNKAVFYSDYIDNLDIWNNYQYDKYLQFGKDRGERMFNAFRIALNIGYKKVVLIRANTPSLSPVIINNAFKALEDTKIVIGPSENGGYFLLGMTEMVRCIFKDKDWGGNSVLKDTSVDLNKLKIDFKRLKVLNEIETVEDIQEFEMIKEAIEKKKQERLEKEALEQEKKAGSEEIH